MTPIKLVGQELKWIVTKKAHFLYMGDNKIATFVVGDSIISSAFGKFSVETEGFFLLKSRVTIEDDKNPQTKATLEMFMQRNGWVQFIDGDRYELKAKGWVGSIYWEWFSSAEDKLITYKINGSLKKFWGSSNDWVGSIVVLKDDKYLIPLFFLGWIISCNNHFVMSDSPSAA